MSLVFRNIDNTEKVWSMLDTVQSPQWQPLTPAQFDFWEEFTFHPHQPVSTVAHRITLRGDVNEQALLAALEQTISETDVFAIQFHQPDKHAAPLQCCDPQKRPQVRIIDLQTRASSQMVARSMMQGDIDGQLNLLRQPLAAVWLIRFSPDHYTVYIRAHHIIVDGFGMALIEHRLAELYSARSVRAFISPPLQDFEAFLAEEQRYACSEKSRRDCDYWNRCLSCATALPVLQKGGEDYGCECLHCDGMLPPAFGSELNRLAEKSGIGWPDLLLALSAVWLLRYLPDSPGIKGSLPVWVPVMNRRGAVAASVPALAVNILPLFVHIEEQESLASYLQRTTTALRDLRAHGRYRIETLAADQGLGLGTRYFFSPLINVLPFDPPVFAGCEIEREVMASGPGDGFNITWRSRTDASDMHIDIDADPARYSTENVDRDLQQLVAFLRQAMQPDAWKQPLIGLLE